MKLRLLPLLLTFSAPLAPVALAAPAVAETRPAIAGAWIARDYIPKSGVKFAMRGQVMFSGDRWSLTYAVLDDGKIQRTFAQVGSFTASGGALSLFGDVAMYPYAPAVEGLWEQPERYHLFGARDTQKPVNATASVSGDTLTLVFGSGSRMTFDRAGG